MISQNKILLLLLVPHLKFLSAGNGVNNKRMVMEHKEQLGNIKIQFKLFIVY